MIQCQGCNVYYIFIMLESGILVAYPSGRWLSSREAEVRIPNCQVLRHPFPWPGNRSSYALALFASAIAYEFALIKQYYLITIII
jgi:hypothetical protein